MSTPSTDDTPSFEAQVNDIVSKATVDDKGNLQLPEGVTADDSVLYAAKLAKRHRDTQASLTKAQQRAKALEVENSKLASSWEADAVSSLSNSEQARLEELKSTDPEAWRTEITALEEAKRNQFKEKRTAITQEASQLTELEQREAELEAFNAANPDFAITDEVIENDIPPRITNKLKKGEISFAEFLEMSKKYIETPKTVATGAAPAEPSLANANGGHRPTEEAERMQSHSDYNTEIF